MENIALQSLQIFYIIVLRREIATTFDSNILAISTCKYKTIKTLPAWICLQIKN